MLGGLISESEDDTCDFVFCHYHFNASFQAVIKSEDLLVGDLVHVREGQTLSADCLVLRSCNLEVDESMITGESAGMERLCHGMPVAKCSRLVLQRPLFVGEQLTPDTVFGASKGNQAGVERSWSTWQVRASNVADPGITASKRRRSHTLLHTSSCTLVEAAS